MPGRRPIRVLWPLALVAGVVAASWGPQPATLVARACAFALAIASLVVLTGWTGQLNLHVAAIGLGWGAYAAAGLAAHGVPELAAILIAPVAVLPAAVAVGIVAVRFRGIELAIATLAAGLVFEQMIFQNLGKWLSPASTGTQFESSLLALDRPAGFEGERAFAFLALAILAVLLVAVAVAGRGRTGRTLRVIRDREVVAEARGVPVFAWRLAAFVCSIAVAAAAGSVLAAGTGAVTADSFGFPLSLQILAVATLAGIRRLESALAGATLLILFQEAATLGPLKWVTGDRADLVFGLGLIAVLAVATRRDLVKRATSSHLEPAAAKRATGRREAVEDVAAQAEKPGARLPTLLRIADVHVSFAERRVLRGVDMRVGEGEVVGLIGGNGAGKTTLFNCITGLVTPGAGRVFFRGIDVTDMAPHRRARLGLARTFQGVEVFGGLTVEEGLMVAAGMRGRSSDREIRERVRSALAEVGVADDATADPGSLPLATLRLVEIATALVAEPVLVLLDEPLAGLDAIERSRVLDAVRRLRAERRSVVIVEHDAVAVESVADRVYELTDGRAVLRTRRDETPRKRAPAKRRQRVASRA